MASDYDSTEFVDGDFQRQGGTYGSGAASSPAGTRAPSREEVDAKVAEAQAKLAELKRAQEELERERSALEETRRRQIEFQTGRTEMVQHLTRAVGILEEAEFASRRDAEQMSKSIAEMRSALGKVQTINEQSWSKEHFNAQLTQALTAIENARMEWNSARLKFPVLSTVPTEDGEGRTGGSATLPEDKSFVELCRYGLALTWPVAAAVLAVGVVVALLLMKH